MRIERSYAVAASTVAEGPVSFLIPPYLDGERFPVGIIGILVAAREATLCRSPMPSHLPDRQGN